MSSGSIRFEQPMATLTDEGLRLLDAYWRTANYLSVGQIYLLDNPLPREASARTPRSSATGSASAFASSATSGCTWSPRARSS